MADLGVINSRAVSTVRLEHVGWSTNQALVKSYNTTLGQATIYRVMGRVLENGTPVRRVVRVYSPVDGAQLAVTWSDAVTGEFVADFLDHPGNVHVMVLGTCEVTYTTAAVNTPPTVTEEKKAGLSKVKRPFRRGGVLMNSG